MSKKAELGEISWEENLNNSERNEKEARRVFSR